MSLQLAGPKSGNEPVRTSHTDVEHVVIHTDLRNGKPFMRHQLLPFQAIFSTKEDSRHGTIALYRKSNVCMVSLWQKDRNCHEQGFS
jgi:hypothetical protein